MKKLLFVLNLVLFCVVFVYAIQSGGNVYNPLIENLDANGKNITGAGTLQGGYVIANSSIGTSGSIEGANFYGKSGTGHFNYVIAQTSTSVMGTSYFDGQVIMQNLITKGTSTMTLPITYFDAAVSHGMTSIVPTDVFGRIKIINTDGGGLSIEGLQDATGASSYALAFVGAHAVTPSLGYIQLNAQKKTGTTWTTIGVTEEAVGFWNGGITRLLSVKGNGNVEFFPYSVNTSTITAIAFILAPGQRFQAEELYTVRGATVTGDLNVSGKGIFASTLQSGDNITLNKPAANGAFDFKTGNGVTSRYSQIRLYDNTKVMWDFGKDNVNDWYLSTGDGANAIKVTSGTTNVTIAGTMANFDDTNNQIVFSPSENGVDKSTITAILFDLAQDINVRGGDITLGNASRKISDDAANFSITFSSRPRVPAIMFYDGSISTTAASIAGGDMNKATYDADENGVTDDAENLDAHDSTYFLIASSGSTIESQYCTYEVHRDSMTEIEAKYCTYEVHRDSMTEIEAKYCTYEVHRDSMINVENYIATKLNASSGTTIAELISDRLYASSGTTIADLISSKLNASSGTTVADLISSKLNASSGTTIAELITTKLDASSGSIVVPFTVFNDSMTEIESKYLHVEGDTVTGDITMSANKAVITATGTVHFAYTISLPDTGEYILSAADGKAGFGYVFCHDEYTFFNFTTAAAVTIHGESANVTTTNDNDTSINIYDGGTSVVIENQLGGAYSIFVSIDYVN